MFQFFVILLFRVSGFGVARNCWVDSFNSGLRTIMPVLVRLSALRLQGLAFGGGGIDRPFRSSGFESVR